MDLYLPHPSQFMCCTTYGNIESVVRNQFFRELAKVAGDDDADNQLTCEIVRLAEMDIAFGKSNIVCNAPTEETLVETVNVCVRNVEKALMEEGKLHENHGVVVSLTKELS